MSFDLSALDTTSAADQGATMHVAHPVTGVALSQEDGSPVSLILAGEDSERFRKQDRTARSRRLARQQQGRAMKLSADELDSDALEMLVAVTVGWSGLALDGADLPYSPDNARKLYTRLPWLREQAQAFVLDRANFLKA